MKTGVILAAGLGKRMNSKRHKVVHEVCGKPMIVHIVDQMQAVGLDRLFVVVGKLEEQVRDAVGDRGGVEFVRQTEQLGTGHAVLQALPLLPEGGITVVAYGDMPLIRATEIERLIRRAEEENVTAQMTAELDEPFGYGRVLRDETGDVLRVVEERDATAEEKRIREVNTGVYAFQTAQLRAALPLLTFENAQRELLLTDCVGHIRTAGGRIVPIMVEDPDDMTGVNDRVQLAQAEEKMRHRLLLAHMQSGVTVIDPASTYVGADVVIGRDTVLLPGTHATGATVIGEDCVIGPNAQIVDSVVGNGVRVNASVLVESRVGNEAVIGPFAYLRPGSVIGPRVKIGDFVEIKNATIGEDTKISHLAYIGDSAVGARANIACGVVTANYDGFQKHRTEIGDDSFIGCNVNLVAPVRVGNGAYIATGSTVTDEVPDDSFAIARQRQTTKPDYAPALRERLKRGAERAGTGE